MVACMQDHGVYDLSPHRHQVRVSPRHEMKKNGVGAIVELGSHEQTPYFDLKTLALTFLKGQYILKGSLRNFFKRC
jgi:hypothetical protein